MRYPRGLASLFVVLLILASLFVVCIVNGTNKVKIVIYSSSASIEHYLYPKMADWDGKWQHIELKTRAPQLLNDRLAHAADRFSFAFQAPGHPLAMLCERLPTALRVLGQRS